ncbi:MAG: hypothetical protein M1812_000802 [Candelaria pacifica]|nr:MAG: hypothetical protein M1812_000802 [Candelaria pacifica]
MNIYQLGFVAFVLYIIGGVIYRLYLSPIAKFPGPKLNALTFWVEIYYDVIKKGQYFHEVDKLHQKYGPIVRINPHELHIKDRDFYNDIYVGANVRKSDKWNLATKGFPTSGAGFSTVPHDLHRLRRGAINPYFSNLIMALPKRVAVFLNPQMIRSLKNQERIDKQIEDIVSGNNDYDKTASHRTIFHEILHSFLPASEKSITRLGHEAQSVIGAAIVTTSGVLSLTSFYLLWNPDKLENLRDSLKGVMADYPHSHPTWAQLEQVPYLAAVVNEGLRMAYGACSRLQRIAPDTAIQYHQWTIPAGIPVSMTSIDMLDDPKIYPSPRTFIPERWLSPKNQPNLQKNFIPFGKGTRSCVGIHVAQAELYLTLSTLFNPNNNVPKMQLFETDPSDVEMEFDLLAPAPKRDSLGVRVLIV